MSVVVSFRIDREVKRKMDELKHVNWSEVVRQAIIDTIRREEEKRREKDLSRIKKAALKSETLSRRVRDWNSTREIRRWRELL